MHWILIASGGFKTVRLVGGENVVDVIRSLVCLHSRRSTDTVTSAPQQRRTRTSAYCSPVDSEEDLIACIAEAAATPRQRQGVFELARQSLLRRRRLFIEVGGRTF
jgi:hypothetical protein